MSKKLIYSKDIVERYHISYPTVTHYTNLGFFKVVEKSGNKRLYDEEQVKEKLEQIKKMIKEGYPLRIIRERIVG